jgi:DDE superfamily endonuclease
VSSPQGGHWGEPRPHPGLDRPGRPQRASSHAAKNARFYLCQPELFVCRQLELRGSVESSQRVAPEFLNDRHPSDLAAAQRPPNTSRTCARRICPAQRTGAARTHGPVHPRPPLPRGVGRHSVQPQVRADDVRHWEKWRLALDMLDEMIQQWGLPKLPVAVDSGYGDCTLVRLGLTERDLRYAVQVDPNATAHPGSADPVTPPYAGRGRPPRPVYPEAPTPSRPALPARTQDLEELVERRPANKLAPSRRGAPLAHFP